MSNDLRFRALLDDKVSSSLDRIKDKLDTTFGKGTASTAFGVAAAKGLDVMAGSALKAGEVIGDFIGDSLDAASNLNETMSKSSVVFGKAANDISQWGDQAADSFGLSKQAAIEAAASFGNVFKGLGFAEQKSADMSKRLVELAGDLASFNNLDPTDALDKLKSGLAGEAEPLRSMGVFLNEAQVKAKAMQLGLGDAHGELTEGEKILARYNLILEQTKTAQGDFARTSNEVANSERRKNAALEDARAELGQNFIPVEKFATDAQLNFLRGLNLVADGLQGKVTPLLIQHLAATGELGQATGKLHEQIHTLDEQTLRTAASFGVFTAAELQAELDARGLGDAARYAAVSQAEAADSSVTSGEKIRGAFGLSGKSASDMAADVEKAHVRIRNTSSRTVKDLLADATELVTGYYDRIITEDDLAATNAEIAAQKRILASSTASAAEKRDAEATLHKLSRDRAEMMAQLASAGDTSSKEFRDAMKALNAELAKSHGAERKEIEAEIRRLQLLALQAAIAKGKIDAVIGATVAKGGYVSAAGAKANQGGNKAGGGPTSEGVAYRIGEFGPETWVSPGDGYVLPNSMTPGGGAGSGGSPVVIQFNSTWPPTPAQARELAAVVNEELARRDRRQPTRF